MKTPFIIKKQIVALKAINPISVGELYKCALLNGERMDSQLYFLLTIPKELSEDPNLQSLLLTNAQKASSTKDLYSMSPRMFGIWDEGLYVVFDFLHGRTLHEILSTGSSEGMPFSPDQAVYITNRVVSSLISMSKVRLSHGLLNPEIIFISFEGDPKVALYLFKDFHRTKSFANPLFNYSRSYISPFLLAENRPVTWKEDVFSLGAILYEMLTCTPLFESVPKVVELEENIDKAFESASNAGRPIPDDLKEVMRRCLLQTDERTYGSIQELKEHLDALINSGIYAPTTFNLAFYLHTLYRDIDEKEELRNRELLSFDPVPLLKKPLKEIKPEEEKAKIPKERVVVVTQSEILSSPVKTKSMLPIYIISAAIVILLLVVGFFFLKSKGKPVNEEELKSQIEAKLRKEYEAKIESLEKERESLEEKIKTAATPEERKKVEEALAETKKQIEAQKKGLQVSDMPSQKPIASNLTETRTSPAVIPAKVQENTSVESTQKPSQQAILSEQNQQSNRDVAPAAVPSPKAENAEPQPQEPLIYEPTEVDTPPKLTKEVKPIYPKRAMDIKEEGRVSVRVVVDESGSVADAQIIRVFGNQDLGFDKSTLEAAKKWKYSPGIKGGKPVKVKMYRNIVFSL